jgi:hypothetical protein
MLYPPVVADYDIHSPRLLLLPVSQLDLHP